MGRAADIDGWRGDTSVAPFYHTFSRPGHHALFDICPQATWRYGQEFDATSFSLLLTGRISPEFLHFARADNAVSICHTASGETIRRPRAELYASGVTMIIFTAGSPHSRKIYVISNSRISQIRHIIFRLVADARAQHHLFSPLPPARPLYFRLRRLYLRRWRYCQSHADCKDVSI